MREEPTKVKAAVASTQKENAAPTVEIVRCIVSGDLATVARHRVPSVTRVVKCNRN